MVPTLSATSIGTGPSLAQPAVALSAMHKSLQMEAGMDLQKEPKAAISLVCGKRTKLMMTTTIKAKPIGTSVRKCSRL
jgi:hypothetical protein